MIPRLLCFHIPCKHIGFFLFLFLVFFQPASAQTLKGKITDADTRQAVSFAAVFFDNTNHGITADLDGNFEIGIPVGAQAIHVNMVGYVKKTVLLADIDLSGIVPIKLKSNNINLSEIVIKPGENPAIPVIQKVIANKPGFDISNLPRYMCTSYAKTYFTLSDRNGNETHKKKITDTSDVSLLRKTYFLFMESVTERRYNYKNITQEKVIASKVSGFKSAPFGVFASQLQSFTFYNDKIELMGLSYLNPLSKNTFKHYRFEIIDSVLNYPDTTLLIKFFPKKNAAFKALKGVLYINKNQYVLASVLAEPAEIATDGTGIKIQQLYEKIDSTHWFPKQLNTELLFYGMHKSTDTVSSILKGVSRVYIKDVKLDTLFTIRDKSISAFNAEGFDKKEDAFWKTQRVDSLTEKETGTYRVIDSIGEKAKFTEKLKWLDALSSGKFQVGYINLDLKYLLRFNDYEGFRLGAGISTSNKLSRWVSLGGYGGYGFKDKAWKYGSSGRINFNRRQSAFFLGEIAHEVTETAGTYFLQETNNFISTEKLRDYLVSKMDKVDFAKASLNTSLFHFIKASAYFQVQQRQSVFGFTEPDNIPANEITRFTLNETGVQLKIWPKEKFTESMGRLVSTGSKWPVFFINVAKGLTNNVYGYTGSFDYTKLDLRIDHQLNFKVKGFVSYQVQAGKVFGDVPYSIQYNNKGSLSSSYKISVEKTLETMYLNEFISTQYAALFFAINSGRIFRPNKYFNPELELVHNYAIGTLDNPTHLTNIAVNDISKGFTEAGLRLKGLYKSSFTSFGAGAYYRYGNYAFDKAEKNLVLKLVLSYSL